MYKLGIEINFLSARFLKIELCPIREEYELMVENYNLVKVN